MVLCQPGATMAELAQGVPAPLRIHIALLALAGDGLREQVQKIDEALAFSTQSPVDVPEPSSGAFAQ